MARLMNQKGFTSHKMTWLIAVLSIIVIGLGAVMLMRGIGNKDNNSKNQDVLKLGTKTACELLNDSAAKEVLGEGAKQSDLPASDVSTDEANVSTCLYNDGTTGDASVTASLVVKGAKNVQGYESNKYGFEQTKTQSLDGQSSVESVPITTLGHEAYFNPSFGQVNILVNTGQYWLFMQVSKGSSTGDRALGEQLAAKIVKNL